MFGKQKPQEDPKDKKLRKFLFGCEEDDQMNFGKLADKIREAKSKTLISSMYYIYSLYNPFDRPEKDSDYCENLSIQEELNAIKKHLGIEVKRVEKKSEEKIVIKKI